MPLQPHAAVAGNCANCNHPTDQHHPRCPTRPYQGKHERFPTEPQPASAQMVTLNATDDALAIERPGVEYPWHDRSWVIAQNRSADTGEPFRLGADIRDGIEKLGHRLLLVHGIMMPRTCGHGHHTTRPSTVGRLYSAKWMWHIRVCMARRHWAGLGEAALGRIRPGPARHGGARRGEGIHKGERHTPGFRSRAPAPGWAWQRIAGPGRARLDRGASCQVRARQGTTGRQAPRFGPSAVTLGMAGRCMARQRPARRVMAWPRWA